MIVQGIPASENSMLIRDPPTKEGVRLGAAVGQICTLRTISLMAVSD